MRQCIVIGTHVAGLGVIRSLGEMGVPVVALHYLAKDMGYLSRYVSRSVRLPHPEAEAAQFLDFLRVAEDLHGGVLVPTEDAAMVAVSRHKDELDRLYLVALPEWEVIRKIIKKKHTYEIAARLGIPCPRTITPASAEEALRFAEQIGFPCLVKPCVGHRFFEAFGAKMVAAAGRAALLEACHRAWEADLEVMIQELIPGDDSAGVNYNSYFWEGRALAEFTAAKVRLAPAGLGFPRVVVSQQVPEVTKDGRALLRALGFYGYSCMEFKRDPRDRTYKLMEVNGRHNVSSRLAVRCGMNFPWMTYQHLTSGHLPLCPPPRQGVYWIDEFKDITYSVAHRRRERYPLKAYLKPYLSPHVFATFAWDDPLPFVKRSAYLARQCLAALGRKVKPSRKVPGYGEKRREEARSPAPRWTGP